MKTLQNDFTTPEQSKRLLELGVPADSANMGYQALNGKCYSNDMCGWRVSPSVLFIAKPDWSKHEWYPCWSVGRLIEIILKCSTLDKRQVLYFCDGDDDYYSFIDYTINVLESAIITNHIDFSKLED